MNILKLSRNTLRAALGMASAALLCAAPGQKDDLTPQAVDGYRGIWYYNGKLEDEYRYKYSGGFATYPQWHMPFAIHVPSQRKTFFVYGGSAGNISETGDQLEHLVSYFDHATGTLPRPMRVLLKRTQDAHDNPVLSIDAAGHLYVFSAAHGRRPTSYIHRSRRPYDIREWDVVADFNFSYPQPWYLPESRRFFFLHTLYAGPGEQLGQRGLTWRTSRDGESWSEPHQLANIENGNYQLSARHGDTDRVAIGFDLHPSHGRAGTGLNYRTNIYYLETKDAGRTWQTVDGTVVRTPLTEATNPALVRDYRSPDMNVYLKCIVFTGDGRPVILYLTSKSWQPGPDSAPYQWHTAEWTGKKWNFRQFTTSDHNYDHGELYIEADGTWRIIAPTAPGPQPFGTGGEMLAWHSRDRGQTWSVAHTLTENSKYNHTYARRPVNAHPEFYAIWADGSPFNPTPSSLHFATKDGKVYRLPQRMSGSAAEPERIR